MGRPCLACAGPRPSLKAAAPAQAGLAGIQPVIVGIASRQKVSDNEVGQCASIRRALALPLGLHIDPSGPRGSRIAHFTFHLIIGEVSNGNLLHD